ncbi:MAG: cytoplasmic protein [Deltaproteobacteria bacterium]|nr:cytoplasmic protein [Deltaproteobacteria bacterium]
MTENQIEFAVEKNNLYREESFTDLKTVLIRCLTPTNPDGTVDESREKVFIGHTQLMSPQGPLPLQAPLEAATLSEAIEKFPEAMHKAMAEMIENVKKIQQEQEKAKQEEESRILMPGR